MNADRDMKKKYLGVKPENLEFDSNHTMQKVLKTTLFQELLHRVRSESKKQSNLLLKSKINEIKQEQPDEWNRLISYNVTTKYSSDARQDKCGCLKPKYTEDDLS